MSLLTVATLNIWHDRGPWPLRRGLILEELDPAGGVPQADELAAPLGYEGVYAAASRRPDGALLGNALLSRLSVRRQAMVPLPPDGVEPRSLLCALVDVPEGALPV